MAEIFDEEFYEEIAQFDCVEYSFVSNLLIE